MDLGSSSLDSSVNSLPNIAILIKDEWSSSTPTTPDFLQDNIESPEKTELDGLIEWPISPILVSESSDERTYELMAFLRKERMRKAAIQRNRLCFQFKVCSLAVGMGIIFSVTSIALAIFVKRGNGI